MYGLQVCPPVSRLHLAGDRGRQRSLAHRVGVLEASSIVVGQLCATSAAAPCVVSRYGNPEAAVYDRAGEP